MTNRQALGGFALRGTELHQEGIAREPHGREFLQSRPKPLELPPAHPAFLGKAISALGEGIEFPILREQLHAHVRPRLPPRLLKQRLLKGAQMLPAV